ncbi:MAG: hypothetical protein NVS3B20_05510 [Polyangiales bacterium]
MTCGSDPWLCANRSACALRIVALSMGAAFIVACGSSRSTEGALKQTSTSEHCAPSDAVCAFDGLNASIAVGSDLSLNVVVTTQGAATPPLTLGSANEAVFAIDGHRLHATAPGMSTLLMFAPNELLVDFLALTCESATAVQLHRGTPLGVEGAKVTGTIQLLVGDSIGFMVRPYAGDRMLLGDFDASFSADPAIVRILSEGKRSARRVVPRAPGTTTLEAKALGFAASITVEVLP